MAEAASATAAYLSRKPCGLGRRRVNEDGDGGQTIWPDAATGAVSRMIGSDGQDCCLPVITQHNKCPQMLYKNETQGRQTSSDVIAEPAQCFSLYH